MRTLILSLLLASGAAAQTMTYRSCARLPERQATGLSSISYTGEGDTYWGALEWASVLEKLHVKLTADGSIASAKIVGEVRLAQERRDLEGCAFTSPKRNTLLVSDETAPGITEISLADGKLVQSLTVPQIFHASMTPNQGFESLTFSTDHKTLWTANERALKIDGNPQVVATPIFSSTRVRLLKYEVKDDTYTPAGQFEYETSGVHDWGGQIGLCDLTALPDGRLLALERSAAMNFSRVATIRTRVFIVDVAGATDISKPPYDRGLVDRTPVKVRKTLVYDGFVCSEHGENLEGLCLGPKLGGNRWAVLGVVDDTDGNLNLSKTSVVSFELNLDAPAPTTQATTATTAPRRPPASREPRGG